MAVRHIVLIAILTMICTPGMFGKAPLHGTEDSLATALSQNHAFVMKLIDRLSGISSRWIREKLSPHNPGASAYAGQENREIKALPVDRIQQLLDGEGMGLAKSAELNGFPGPRHVLDLATQLHLDSATRQSVESSFQAMHSDAVRLGKQLVAREENLDRLFRSGTVTRRQLRAMLSEIGRLEGELRFVHLEAHVKTHRLLDDNQNALYQKLRGYQTLSRNGR
jgi:hypothetical protein